jgi:ferredoxin
MIELIMSCLALLTVGFSFFKSQSLEKELEDLDLRIQQLKERTVQIPFRLKSKINRFMALERKKNSKPIPIIRFESLDKSAPSFFSSDTIYSLAEDEGFGLTGTCEGNGDCGLCAIEVLEGIENINPVNEIEKEILNKLDYKDGTRLCCQTHISGNVTVNFIAAKDQ